MFQSIGDGGHRNGRGIGRQHAVVTHDAFEFLEQATFGFQFLDNRLDHQAGVGGLLQAADGRDPVQRLRHRRFGQFSLGDQTTESFSQSVFCRGGGVGAHIKETYAVAGLRCNLGNARAHDARANHQDGPGLQIEFIH